jgi:hypothetical protein
MPIARSSLGKYSCRNRGLRTKDLEPGLVPRPKTAPVRNAALSSKPSRCLNRRDVEQSKEATTSGAGNGDRSFECAAQKRAPRP